MCHVMSCHVMLRHVISCHVMSCQFASIFFYGMILVSSRTIGLIRVTLCHVMLCHVISYHVVSCHVMSIYVHSFLFFLESIGQIRITSKFGFFVVSFLVDPSAQSDRLRRQRCGLQLSPTSERYRKPSQHSGSSVRRSWRNSFAKI